MLNWWLGLYIIFFLIALGLLAAHIVDTHFLPLWGNSEKNDDIYTSSAKTFFVTGYIVLIFIEIFKAKIIKVSANIQQHWFFSQKFQRDYCNWIHKMKWNGWKIIGWLFLVLAFLIIFTALAIIFGIRSFALFFIWSLYSYIISLIFKSKSFCFYNRDNLNQF